MNKFLSAKFIIYSIPVAVVLLGLLINNMQSKKEDSGQSTVDKNPIVIDYAKLEELAKQRPNGERFVGFIRENEADIGDDDPGNDSDAYISMGFNLHALGDDAMAVEAYKRGLDIDPSNSFGINNIASSYIALGQLDKAEEAYRQLAQRLSGDAETYIKLAELHLRRFPDNVEEFMNILEEGVAVSAGANKTTLLAYLASYFSDRGEIERAIGYLEELIEFFPGHPDIDFYKDELERLRELVE